MQSRQLSASIVLFISKLTPLYVPEYRGNVALARSLRDGSLVLPVDEEPEDENGWVTVAWGGDEAKASNVQGIYLAELAIGEYVRLHSLSKPERAAAELEHLHQHFQVKTGESFALPPDRIIDILEALSKLIEKLGPIAVLTALKKLLGG